MPNVNAVLNEQIRRLARREIRANTKTIKRATGHYRRDIAALKRQVAQLTKLMGTLQKAVPSQTPTPPAEVLQKSRLRVSGLKAHRARLGLSAKDYGRLMGVSGLTIYHWEAGKSKPRRSQLPSIVAVRGIGKREAMQRLGMGEKPEAGKQPMLGLLKQLTPGAGYTRPVPRPVLDALRKVGPTERSAAPKRRGRGSFKQTAEEMILGLLKGRKALTAAQINVVWKKEGRKGTSAMSLSKMTKAKKLKRVVVKGQRGGEYRVG